MWLPTDDGFLAAQAQEALALARADIARSPVPSAAASVTANALRVAVGDNDADMMAQIAVVAGVALFWLLLCGICRCYVCLPCPCCVCYIPCCCGFCLPKEREPQVQRHRHDVHHYPGTHHIHHRSQHADLPAYDDHAVNMKQPLLGTRTYTGPPGYEAPPPAYHDVPTAPPLTPP